MPLLGSAAMLLSFDVELVALDEHDRWHTHEHLPERLSIPGFLRGTRWVASEGAPRYLVLYEVESLATLASSEYLERLNNPTPWTTRIMPWYRGMRRGLCSVIASLGHGQGGYAALLAFTPTQPHSAELHRWLLEEVFPAIPTTAGLGSVHLLQGARPAAMTNEQRIRGADLGIDSAVVITGYDATAVAEQASKLRGSDGLAGRAASDTQFARYHLAYSLTSAEVRM